MRPLTAAFRQQLQQLGWSEDGIQIDLRVALVDVAQFQSAAAALASTAPVIVALSSRADG
jgi:hypothetical protein